MSHRSTYYDINALVPWSDAAVRHISNPSDFDRYRAGRRELVPFVPEDGMVVIPGTRRVERDGDTVREVYDTEHEAEAVARSRAAYLASIPADIIPLAAAYRTTIRALFGGGAETNHAITEQVVTAFFLSKRAANEMTQELDNAERILEIGSREIRKLTPDGTCWTFPWEVVP